MKKKSDQSADTAELRCRAEERLGEKRKSQKLEDGNQSTADDTARLVHELQVHQIELEMQNEELRQAHAQVEMLLAQYTDLYDFAPAGYLTLDREGAIRQMNLTAARLFGVERSQLVNRRFGLFGADGDRRTFSDFLQKVFASEAKESCEVTLQHESSHPVVVRIEGTRSADGQECRVVLLDLTERKQAEDALRESEARLNLALETTHTGAWDLNLLDHTAYRTLIHDRIFGYETLLPSWTYEMFLEHVLPDDRPEVDRTFREATAAQSNWNVECRIRRADGEVRWIQAAGGHGRNSEDKPVRMSGLVQDITERKRAEAALQRSEALLRTTGKLARIGGWEFDVAMQKQIWTEEVYEIHEVGLDYEPTMSKGVDFYAPEAKPIIAQAMQRAIEYGEPFDLELPFITAKGNRLWVHAIGQVRQSDGKTTKVFGTFQDITERRTLEEEFRQAQKLEGIGQLAAGVAHDFNNILAVIQLHASLMKTEQDLSPQQLESASEIEKAAKRAANLTRQLLLFSRRQTMQLRDLDLNQSINDMTKMLRRTIGDDIQVQFKFAMQSLLIHADAGMMDQVLMNLAVNAHDAMPQGGQLVIETSAVEFDESVRAQSPLARPGSFVCLSVGDTGCGIPPENLPRIFEPFFTTKDVGKGTGLGLATVFGIVQQHQGWINVYSEVGRGTIFRIYLPRLAAKSGQESGQPELATVRGGSETILLVEDEGALRSSMRKALSQLGYRVLESVSGVEALKVWEQHRNKIVLLVTDMVMPGGMTGKDLAERFLKENSKLKVIYTSGYSVEVASRDFPLEEGVNFLAKPFGAQKLAQIVRQNLDADSASSAVND